MKGGVIFTSGMTECSIQYGAQGLIAWKGDEDDREKNCARFSEDEKGWRKGDLVD